MPCKDCGGTMVGDGDSSVYHCENTPDQMTDGIEADAGPIYCGMAGDSTSGPDKFFDRFDGAEQRSDVRSELSWPVSLWFPEMNQFYNGKTINVSKTGAIMSMPLSMPIRLGHDVEINFPRTTSLARQKGQYARIKLGRVVRVGLMPGRPGLSTVAVEFGK